MKTELQALEEIAVELDARADHLFGDIARELYTAERAAEADVEAQAYRRAAEIVRHQIECEA